MLTLDETIIAQASPQGSGANGIIRLSGADSVNALQNVFFPNFSETSVPRIAEGFIAAWEYNENVNVTEIASRLENRLLPCVLYFWPQGRGFTGQMAVELHTVGSQPVLDAVIQKILAQSNAAQSNANQSNAAQPSALSGTVRLANPGEFTLRAFLAGKIDLTQAEAVLGVIDAVDTEHLNVALKQLAGGIARPLHGIREQLLDSLAQLEAGLDFAEEDIEFISAETLRSQLIAANEQIERILNQIANRSESNRLPHVVLVGLPNAGKSTLYNKLSEQSESESSLAFGAIVSPTPGTTRDYLKTQLDFGGVKFVLVDTAGLENNVALRAESEAAIHTTSGCSSPKNAKSVDQSAQIFSLSAIAEADIIVFCTETYDETADYYHFSQLFSLPHKPLITVHTKCDEKRDKNNSENKVLRTDISGKFIETSARSGIGIAELKRQITETLLADRGCIEIVPATAVRCRDSLQRALLSLRSAVMLTDELLIASELRAALDALGLVVGAVHTEELLDRIFSRFCIGK